MRRRRSSVRSRPFTNLASLAALGAILAAATPAHAGDGVLGVFLDRNARECSGNIGSGTYRTLFVLLVTEGSTSSGATGIEFRIDASAAGSYLVQSESVPSGAIKLGEALGSGCNVAFGSCQTSSNVAFLSFQVLNPGSGTSDAEIRIRARTSNTPFTCPVAFLCDDPVYTGVCVEVSKATLNPTAPRPCGTTRESAEWSRMKELFR